MQATNPTTVDKIRQAVTRLLGKGENWRLHIYQTLDEALADNHTPHKIGKAYGWVEADAKGIKHAYLIADLAFGAAHLEFNLEQRSRPYNAATYSAAARYAELVKKPERKMTSPKREPSKPSETSTSVPQNPDASSGERPENGRGRSPSARRVRHSGFSLEEIKAASEWVKDYRSKKPR